MTLRLQALLSVLCLGALVVLSGCLHADITKNASTAGEVADCLPPGSPAPTNIFRAIWFPGASGFGSTDNNGMGHLSGVVVLSGSKLYFMTYDDAEKHYDMQHVIDVYTAHDVRVTKMAGSLLLVIQSHNLGYDAFSLMGAANMGSDSDMTQQLCTELEAIKDKNPDKD
jgi:hypothetical protein